MIIAVVIPAYKCKKHIVGVVEKIPLLVDRIYVIDDACPDDSGAYLVKNLDDNRIVVIKNVVNQGVGGAVMRGYLAAVNEGAHIVVKLDGDGQMDPMLIGSFVAPILSGDADYTKGNRFFDIEKVREMPGLRLFGNATLSFFCKISSGYWNIFDPTNGYTAIHANVISRLPLDKISKRYFFESDMLFRLNGLRAVVVDVPMYAKYDDELSNLKVSGIICEFFIKHCINFCKRIIYNYYLRDFSVASIELPLGAALLFFGLIYGCIHWETAAQSGLVTPTGTVMLAALSVLMGTQFLLAFISYDIASIPTRPIYKNIYNFAIQVEIDKHAK